MLRPGAEFVPACEGRRELEFSSASLNNHFAHAFYAVDVVINSREAVVFTRSCGSLNRTSRFESGNAVVLPPGMLYRFKLWIVKVIFF
jgi:hypothetical protein